MKPTGRSLVDLLLLAAGGAVIWLPAGFAGLGLSLLLVLWFRTKPPLRERVLGGGLVFLAILLCLGSLLGSMSQPDLTATESGQWLSFDAKDRETWREQLEEDYGRLWLDLEGIAELAVLEVAEAVSEAGPEEAHRQLQGVVEESAPGTTILLVDSDGSAVSWAGRGLVHEPEAHLIPRQGPAWWTSFAGSSLAVVKPLDKSPRPWRILAGRSYSGADLPFTARLLKESAEIQWSLIEEPGEVDAETITVAAEEGLPKLIVRVTADGFEGRWNRATPRAAKLLVALALLALAVMRGIGVVLLRGTRVAASNRADAVAILLAVGLVALTAALGARGPSTLVLAVGLLLAVGGLLGQRGTTGVPNALLGGLLPVTLVAACYLLQGLSEGIDLVESSWRDPAGLALRLGIFGAALGVLTGWVGRPGDRQTPRDRFGIVAGGLLILGASLHDHFIWGLAAVALAGVFARYWVAICDWRQRPSALLALVVLASLLAAVAWETAHRYELRREIEERFLPAMAPPLAEEFEATWRELDEHFANLDLGNVTPGRLDETRDDDLAYVLWRRSPLARADALSGLVIFPDDGPPVRFSYGLPISADGELEPGRGLWPSTEVPAWGDTLLSGDSPLRHGGEDRGSISFWLQPLPGFRMGPEPVTELASGLLRGGPAGRGPATVLGADLEYGLYDLRGGPVVSPWLEAPPLESRYLRKSRARLETPQGPAWTFVRPEVDGFEVIYLPILGPIEALERVGSLVLATLLLVALMALGAGLAGLPRAAFRDVLRRGVRSYSKRLLLVYAALLIIPLGLLNWLLVRAFEENVLRDQRLAGEAAMASAQQILGDYVVSMDPGFVISTALDDTLLTWLSSVIHYEVNLYWGSSINGSSKRELFTAGLLPERIPGDIFSRLALRRENLAARTSQAGSVRYLELYAPLAIPGVDSSERRIFVSLPLLAQQEESRQAIAFLRRRAILITLLLTLVAAVIGSRLARSFTRPLHELVEGTKRIAAGATSLDLAPTELELAALVEAIDDMARRIAEGRLRLEREKQVMETIVENVTSGVVSVDSQQRVVMGNRLARELLGVSVGDHLLGATRSRERLEPLTGFLEAADDRLVEGSVRLALGEDDERDFRLVWVPVPDSTTPAALFVLEDATEVLRAERLEAWAEMARIIAHEIKNPLTPIRLSTEHLREVWNRSPQRLGEVFERCTVNILRQVEELQQIAMEFSTYSHIPRLDRQPGDLVVAVRELAEMYFSAAEEGVAVVFEGPGEPLEAEFDARLLGRAVRNLAENAIRAGGHAGPVVIAVRRCGERAEISVADQGPGVDSELLNRIFDPYFSTHDSGTGLGLPIARRVAEEHQGSIQARNRPGGGLEVVLSIPLSRERVSAVEASS